MVQVATLLSVWSSLHYKHWLGLEKPCNGSHPPYALHPLELNILFVKRKTASFITQLRGNLQTNYFIATRALFPMIRTTPSTRSRRLLRCQRCSEKKFRTRQDLALHILSKHATLKLPNTPADDTRSITLSSPWLPSDINELDQLLGAALGTNFMSEQVTLSRADSIRHCNKSFEPNGDASKKATQIHTAGSKRKRTAFEETSTSHSCQNAPARRLSKRKRSQTCSSTDRNPTPVPGESIGPCSHDVYLAQCRSGQVSLVPIPLKPATTLNFANALF